MVDVQQRSLRAFEDQRVAAFAGPMDQRCNVRHHLGQFCGVCHRLVAHRLERHRRTFVVMNEREIVILEQCFQLGAESIAIEQVLNAHGAPRDLVFVRRPDAAAGRSDFGVAHTGFASLVERRVHRQHQRTRRRDLQSRTNLDTGGFELGDFRHQG